MKRPVWMFLLLAAGVLLLLGKSTPAATVLPLSLTDLVRQSDLVVEARIVSGTADFSGPAGTSMIFTYWQVQVLDAVKGTLPPRLLVRTPGGTKDNRSLTVPGAPGFQPNQEKILFLKRTEEVRGGVPVFEVLGWEQGALNITREPSSGERIVLRRPEPASQGRSQPAAVKVKDLKQQIRVLSKPTAEPGPKEVSP